MPDVSHAPEAAAHPIVGVWEVRAVGAPLAWHVMTFHADGTMLQSNPPAGNPHTSDSAGMGIWRVEGHSVAGKFVEVRADKSTGEVVGSGQIRFRVTVAGSRFTGHADTSFEGAGSTVPVRLLGRKLAFEH